MFGKILQDTAEQLGVDVGENPPVSFSGLRLDKRIQPQPLALPVHRRHGGFACLCPNLPGHWLQPDAMLIFTPNFDGSVGIRLLNALHNAIATFFSTPPVPQCPPLDAADGARASETPSA